MAAYWWVTLLGWRPSKHERTKLPRSRLGVNRGEAQIPEQPTGVRRQMARPRDPNNREGTVMTRTPPPFALASALLLVSLGCHGPSGRGDGEGGIEPGQETGGPGQASPFFHDVSVVHLPPNVLDGPSMDAAVADIDADGDLDIVVANEFRPNILLLNDGAGRFSDGSERLPRTQHDSEDVGIADFDADGDLDIMIVSEDDLINELYLNDGDGTFTDASDRIPVTGTTNGLVVADLDGDGAPDGVLANNGQDAVVMNDGSGHFRDETRARLPVSLDVTQDVELGDVDGDGDPDLVVGNEGPNGLYMNDGTGHFTDESRARIPLRSTPEETREADFGDVDGDGDLDLLFANVSAFVAGADPRNRLLINDGRGFFSDESEARLPPDTESSFDGDFRDLDGDGDLDIVTGNSDVDLSQRQIAPALFRAYLNDGTGHFSEATLQVFGEGITGTGFDLEFGDFDGDGLEDVFLASRGTADRLLLRVR